LYHALTYASTATTNKNKFQWETTYKARFDLRGHCDLFVSPIYNTNNTFYHNGNDAMGLLKGTTVNSPLIDLVGIKGDISMAPTSAGDSNLAYWSDPNTTGYNAILTKDRTLQRKSNIKKGKVLDYDLGDTQFNVADWTLYSADYFMGLGTHTCECLVTATTDKRKTANFEYFPNPIRKGVLTLKGSEGMRSATLYNILGQAIRSEKLNGDVTNQIDLSGLNSGMFTLTIQFENGTDATQKVIIE
jgi:Secretion system C-terminal sorting domain